MGKCEAISANKPGCKIGTSRSELTSGQFAGLANPQLVCGAREREIEQEAVGLICVRPPAGKWQRREQVSASTLGSLRET